MNPPFTIGQHVSLVAKTRTGQNKLDKSTGNRWRIEKVANKIACFSGTGTFLFVVNTFGLKHPNGNFAFDARWIQVDGQDFEIGAL